MDGSANLRSRLKSHLFWFTHWSHTCLVQSKQKASSKEKEKKTSILQSEVWISYLSFVFALPFSYSWMCILNSFSLIPHHTFASRKYFEVADHRCDSEKDCVRLSVRWLIYPSRRFVIPFSHQIEQSRIYDQWIVNCWWAGVVRLVGRGGNVEGQGLQWGGQGLLYLIIKKNKRWLGRFHNVQKGITDSWTDHLTYGLRTHPPTEWLSKRLKIGSGICHVSGLV